MRANQTLPELTARLITSLDEVFIREQPDAILAQGDTTTVLCSALCAFYQRIPFGHVEAGLRTGDFEHPFPEEMNRVVAGRLAEWHFAPTQQSANNLFREGITQDDVHTTGNTVIDALLYITKGNYPLDMILDPNKRMVLLTCHRRENFGAPLQDIFGAILDLVKKNKDLEVVYPVHPNPNVSKLAHELLGNHERIHLCAPLEYGPFTEAMKQAYLILTDSGGVQEEAPALGKPVLVLRNKTERPEAVEEGVVKLVGTEKSRIVSEAQVLLDSEEAYREMAKGSSPYGDGHASARIVNILKEHFGFLESS